jgi:hypothetical protein
MREKGKASNRGKGGGEGLPRRRKKAETVFLPTAFSPTSYPVLLFSSLPVACPPPQPPPPARPPTAPPPKEYTAGPPEPPAPPPGCPPPAASCSAPPAKPRSKRPRPGPPLASCEKGHTRERRARSSSPPFHLEASAGHDGWSSPPADLLLLFPTPPHLQASFLPSVMRHEQEGPLRLHLLPPPSHSLPHLWADATASCCFMVSNSDSRALSSKPARA